MPTNDPYYDINIAGSEANKLAVNVVVTCPHCNGSCRSSIHPMCYFCRNTGVSVWTMPFFYINPSQIPEFSE